MNGLHTEEDVKKLKAKVSSLGKRLKTLEEYIRTVDMRINDRRVIYSCACERDLK